MLYHIVLSLAFGVAEQAEYDDLPAARPVDFSDQKDDGSDTMIRILDFDGESYKLHQPADNESPGYVARTVREMIASTPAMLAALVSEAKSLGLRDSLWVRVCDFFDLDVAHRSASRIWCTASGDCPPGPEA